METNILFTLGESTINYDPAVPCLVARYVGFHTIEEFRQFMNKGLELLIEKKKVHGRIGWLPDIREGDAQADDGLEWVATDWTIRALAAGISHVAFVLPEDDYTIPEMNAETYAETAQAEIDGEQMTTRMFKDEASAKAWLREALSN